MGREEREWATPKQSISGNFGKNGTTVPDLNIDLYYALNILDSARRLNMGHTTTFSANFPVARDCFGNYQRGVASRNRYPLRNGLYKLEEARGRLEALTAEVDRIVFALRCQRPPYSLRDADLLHCTASDAHVWLKGLPIEICSLLGHDVLPAIRALGSDGVPQGTVVSLASVTEARVDALVNKAESVRLQIKRGIAQEYDVMHMGQSSIAKILETAIAIVVDAIKVASARSMRCCVSPAATEPNAAQLNASAQ